MEKKTGIELIAQERHEQIEKHGYTTERDIELYSDGYGNFGSHLIKAAEGLLWDYIPLQYRKNAPKGWDKAIWLKMVSKPLKERLIMAGALIAAELDRLNAINEKIEREGE